MPTTVDAVSTVTHAPKARPTDTVSKSSQPTQHERDPRLNLPPPPAADAGASRESPHGILASILDWILSCFRPQSKSQPVAAPVELSLLQKLTLELNKALQGVYGGNKSSRLFEEKNKLLEDLITAEKHLRTEISALPAGKSKTLLEGELRQIQRFILQELAALQEHSTLSSAGEADSDDISPALQAALEENKARIQEFRKRQKLLTETTTRIQDMWGSKDPAYLLYLMSVDVAASPAAAAKALKANPFTKLLRSDDAFALIAREFMFSDVSKDTLEKNLQALAKFNEVETKPGVTRSEALRSSVDRVRKELLDLEASERKQLSEEEITLRNLERESDSLRAAAALYESRKAEAGLAFTEAQRRLTEMGGKSPISLISAFDCIRISPEEKAEELFRLGLTFERSATALKIQEQLEEKRILARSLESWMTRYFDGKPDELCILFKELQEGKLKLLQDAIDKEDLALGLREQAEKIAALQIALTTAERDFITAVHQFSESGDAPDRKAQMEATRAKLKTARADLETAKAGMLVTSEQRNAFVAEKSRMTELMVKYSRELDDYQELVLKKEALEKEIAALSTEYEKTVTIPSDLCSYAANYLLADKECRDYARLLPELKERLGIPLIERRIAETKATIATVRGKLEVLIMLQANLDRISVVRAEVLSKI